MPDPVLHTERLVLRPVSAQLATSLLATSPPVTSALSSSPPATSRDGSSLRPGPGFPGELDRSVLAGVAAAGADAEGTWLVVRDGEIVGTLGVAGPVSPCGDQEVGYALVPSARGDGVGTEAVGAVCALLERRPGVRRLTAQVLPGNEASLRLLHRLGFEQLASEQARPSVLLARAAPGAPALTGTEPVRSTVAPRIPGRHVC